VVMLHLLTPAESLHLKHWPLRLQEKCVLLEVLLLVPLDSLGSVGSVAVLSPRFASSRSDVAEHAAEK
jgi:hypothetical protein